LLEAAPRDIVKKGFGRIQIGHSELSGYMSNTRAMNEGARAADLALQQIQDPAVRLL